MNRPQRQRAGGAGHPFELSVGDHRRLTVIWLRLEPIHAGRAYLLGVSDSTVSRLIARVLPILEQSGREGMGLPNPGKKRRRQLTDLLKDRPEWTGLVDSFEQRVQRPPHDDRHYSGKTKPPTLKSQLTGDSATGRIVDVAERVPGPPAARRLLQARPWLDRLPAQVGIGGDGASWNLARLRRYGFSPRRNPRDPDRPPEAVVYNRAFSQLRSGVAPTIGQVPRFQSVTATDRHPRRPPTARVVAVAGLVNRLPRFARASRYSTG